MRGLLVAALALMAAACGRVAEQTAPAEPVDASQTAADTSLCEEVGRRVSAQDCALYEQLADSAVRGMAAFNAPGLMQRGQSHTLQLAVSYAPPAAASPAPPASTSQTYVTPPTPGQTVDPLPGDTVAFQPLVGRFMRAELSGPGFDIAPQSQASQEVAPDSVTTWTWEVTARRGGVQALTLTTVVEGCTGGRAECIPLRSTTQNYTVNVEVGPAGRVRDLLAATPDWIKLATAVIAALAGLITAGFAVRNAVRRGRSG